MVCQLHVLAMLAQFATAGPWVIFKDGLPFSKLEGPLVFFRSLFLSSFLLLIIRPVMHDGDLNLTDHDDHDLLLTLHGEMELVHGAHVGGMTCWSGHRSAAAACTTPTTPTTDRPSLPSRTTTANLPRNHARIVLRVDTGGEKLMKIRLNYFMISI